MKVLIDTCVIIDYLQNRGVFAQNASVIFEAAANKKIDAFITAKSLTDIYYIAHHFLHDSAQTKMEVDKLLKVFGLADSLSSDCIMAFSSKIDDFEDAVMAETAKRIKADYLITRNEKDFKKDAGLSVISPQDFVSKFF
jgi:predicted nucleic acid-binding protein